jgi:predicted GNAT family acetyltransferase
VVLVWVADDFRGRGIAHRLLAAFSEGMAELGVADVEAHINDGNASSVTAFRKAGWRVFRMATRDFWACRGDER